MNNPNMVELTYVCCECRCDMGTETMAFEDALSIIARASESVDGGNGIYVEGREEHFLAEVPCIDCERNRYRSMTNLFGRNFQWALA